MDDQFRKALRGYQRGEVEQDAALRALARSGFSRQASVESVDAALRHAFVEELDYGTVERRLASFARSAEPRAVSYEEWRQLARGGPTTEALFQPRAGDPIYANARIGLLYRVTVVSEIPTAGEWLPAFAEDLGLEAERAVAVGLPDEWLARPRANPEAVRVRVWHPCRLDVLEYGYTDDLRLDVSAPLRERSLVIETLMEAFPGATVVSAQVSEGKRPERHPGPKPGEAMWPAESTRVHVR